MSALIRLRRLITDAKPSFGRGRLKSTRAVTAANVHNDEPIEIEFLSLNNIRDNDGAVKVARRVGRGIGSSKGKTCGRGHKGQKSRAGGGVSP